MDVDTSSKTAERRRRNEKSRYIYTIPYNLYILKFKMSGDPMDVDTSSKSDETKNIPDGHPIGTTVEAYWRNSSWRGAIIIERGALFFSRRRRRRLFFLN